MKQRCDACRYLDREDKRTETADWDEPLCYWFCKRFPKWEEHRRGDWCGEWKPREVEGDRHIG